MCGAPRRRGLRFGNRINQMCTGSGSQPLAQAAWIAGSKTRRGETQTVSCPPSWLKAARRCIYRPSAISAFAPSRSRSCVTTKDRPERSGSAHTRLREIPEFGARPRARIVRRFLTAHFGNKALRLQDLQPQDLHRFILRQVPRGSRSYSKLVVTALRSFLRFLRQRGSIKTDLAGALFGVARWRLSHLPKSLPPDQVERLLRCCDRSTASGQRDHTILLLLARLGLRGGEVLADPGRLGLGTRGDSRARQRPAIGTIAVAQRCRHGSGLLSTPRSSDVFDAQGLYPPACPALRPSPDLNLLCGSSRP
jgi:hypothetical protein